MVTTTAAAPPAPGRLGTPVEPSVMLRYLADLAAWRDRRRHELDELDQAALGVVHQGSATPDASVTDDVLLSMALWQAVSSRLAELERVWDSGRVGRVELLTLSSLVWGRLDTSAAGAPARAPPPPGPGPPGRPPSRARP